MTQQEISRLLDIPDRTLRDWKKNRSRLYDVLESLDYDETKEKQSFQDTNDVVVFNPKKYTTNCFWQTNETSSQTVYSIIYNYLSLMDASDIKQICKEYGKSLVRYVLNDKYKKMYDKGYISTGGMDIQLSGSYNKSEMYKELSRIINDC
ncbi:hypothetical protein HUE87_05100 [Candidatus Sulfurimonas marisnigri]|uniref:Uncharacterized protein n=1 Tax=Candidatus Sulfurimonas marisnigri TaxID=2740405 RepID=A0A7S7M2V5_9BACT|nr:hypothetical protein [Candidatus Sulfurimonas marisnigri]QOY55608.1 hypothetical protein HUE87_05100 [Candidatus Sulfurimonas marisnigri]